MLLSPSDLGLPTVKHEEIAGTGDVKGTADIFMNVLEGKGTEAQNSVVIANSAMAINCYFPEKSLEQSVEEAKLSLLGGKALKVFKDLIEAQ
jgi:anthranilate phosphoribosyltransferase